MQGLLVALHWCHENVHLKRQMHENFAHRLSAEEILQFILCIAI